MAYRDFTLETVEIQFGIRTELARLFPNLTPTPIPERLREQLEDGASVAFATEKARSEFIIAPILLAVRRLSQNHPTIHSGYSLNVAPAEGLSGEIDFLLSLSPQPVAVRRPILSVIESKREAIDFGIGQCAAQMVGAVRFNELTGVPATPMYGCVTSGENWTFLRLDGNTFTIDTDRYYLNQLDLILAAFLTVTAMAVP